MRIRLPFAGVFAGLLLLASYLALAASAAAAPALPVNDKVLHLLTFFVLTLAFYWVVDTTRRRTLHLTLLVCTAGLGAGSELLQALLPNGRGFDLLDVAANVVGSLAALGLCAWYHARMLERRRLRKYSAVPAGEHGVGLGDGELDLELGERPGADGGGGTGEQGHEEGVMSGSAGTGDGQRGMTLAEEVDNWDENVVDPWDEDDLGDAGVAAPPAEATSDHGNTAKKRAD